MKFTSYLSISPFLQMIFIIHVNQKISSLSLREKRPNTELFLVRIEENTDQK